MFDTPASPLPSLPGTIPAPRGLFIDRWGTLLDPPSAGFARNPSEVAFYPGALDALFRAGQAGWRIYLVGNEDHVAQGTVADDAWQSVERHIRSELERAGVNLTRDYACRDHPLGVAGHSKDSVYLLPNTGAFYHAAHTDGIDLAKSWAVGDSTLELVAAWRSGCHMAGVQTGLALSDRTFEVDPELMVEDLAAVVDTLLGRTIRMSA